MTNGSTVTQEVASSSLVTPAIFFSPLRLFPNAAIAGSVGGMGGGVIGPVSKLAPNPVSVKLLPLAKQLTPQKKSDN